MSLKLRFFIFSALLLIISSIAVWSAVKTLAEQIIEEWSVRYAEKQVLYDRERTLQPIMREVALSLQFAKSSHLREFARNPSDPKLRSNALLEMENFRFNFSEMNYFVALRATGEYFHNDANNSYQGQQLRYQLKQNEQKDAWFYNLMEQKRELHININPDSELGVTKLWIDVLLKDGTDVLGVVGTGLNLNHFLDQIVNNTDDGVTNFFVDHTASIQLHHDPKVISYASLSKDEPQRELVYQYLDEDNDRDRLRQIMEEAREKKDKVISDFVSSNGHRQLMAVAYIPELDWYEITLIDISKLLPLSRFTGIFVIYALSIIALVILFNLLLRRLVFRPVQKLNTAINQVQKGQLLSVELDGKGEIGSLIQHFTEMADTVYKSRIELEDKVKQRTEALERLSRTDALTHLYNRWGMTERLQGALANESSKTGLIWIDLDFFKEINDQYGHVCGDKALVAVAEIITQQVGDKGFSARWGGDEFLACLPDCNQEKLEQVSHLICKTVEDFKPDYVLQKGQPLPLTVSIGTYLTDKGDDSEQALHCADNALYQAKEEGRNCVRQYR